MIDIWGVNNFIQIRLYLFSIYLENYLSKHLFLQNIVNPYFLKHEVLKENKMENGFQETWNYPRNTLWMGYKNMHYSRFQHHLLIKSIELFAKAIGIKPADRFPVIFLCFLYMYWLENWTSIIYV